MRTSKLVATALAVALMLPASAAFGLPYVIDSSLSSITVTGDVAGAIQIVAQTPGSNVVTFQGTVDASDDGSNITFNGAAADALLQAAPQAPGVGGVAGTAPADAGLAIGPGLGTIAIRDFAISLTSAATPLTAGSFDLTALTLTLSNGTIDFNVPAFSLVGTESLVGQSANPTGGTGNLTGDTLTIPIATTISFEVSDGVFANVNLSGQVVAVAVPEPGTIAMLGVGLVGLVAMGRRRFRRG